MCSTDLHLKLQIHIVLIINREYEDQLGVKIK